MVHTDLRSQKWQELTANPSVSLIGYDAAQRLQLRMCGSAVCHPPKTEITTKAWSGLPPWTRSTYSAGPPGKQMTAGSRPQPQLSEDDATSVGYGVFCVVIIRVNFLDWFSHPRGDIRRIHYYYSGDGQLEQAAEVNP